MILKLLASTGLAASLSAGAVAVQLPFGPDSEGHHKAKAKAHAPKGQMKTKESRRVALDVGQKEKFRAGEAGAATVVRTKLGLKLQLVDAAEGWVSDVERASGSNIDVRFRASGELIRLVVKLDGVSVRVHVITQPLPAPQAEDDDAAETSDREDGHDSDDSDRKDSYDTDDSSDTEDSEEPEDASTTTSSSTTTSTAPESDAPETTFHEVHDAGAVELKSDGEHVTVSDIRVKAAWTFEIKQRSGSGVEVVFHKAKIRLRFKAILVGTRINAQILTEESETDEPRHETGDPADEPADTPPAESGEQYDGGDDPYDDGDDPYGGGDDSTGPEEDTAEPEDGHGSDSSGQG